MDRYWPQAAPRDCTQAALDQPCLIRVLGKSGVACVRIGGWLTRSTFID